MKPFTIIGLTGLKGSGKDTVADILCSHADFQRLAFADALRDEVCDAWCIEPLYLTHRSTKEHPLSALSLRKCLADGFVARILLLHAAVGQSLDLDAPRSPRQIMQWWGTEYRRFMTPDYWTLQLARRLDALLLEASARRFVITDCRFENEVALVRSADYGGLLWAVNRPDPSVAETFGELEPRDTHASETNGCKFAPDDTVDNSRDIRHLQQQVLSLYAAHEWSLPGARVVLPAAADAGVPA